MTDDEQAAADAAQMLRAHQQLYVALADTEAKAEPVDHGEQFDAHVIAWRLLLALVA